MKGFILHKKTLKSEFTILFNNPENKILCLILLHVMKKAYSRITK